MRREQKNKAAAMRRVRDHDRGGDDVEIEENHVQRG